jgi:hypothetical protein
MLDLIDQAPSVQGINSIVFSGGEPMLFPRLIAKGAEQARKHNLQVVIVTNGYWGKWPAAKLAEFFAEVKPDRIHFSADPFHRAYVDDATLGRAIAFTYAMGVYAHIAVSQMKAGLSAQEFWNSMGAYKHLVSYFFGNEARFGRGEQFRSEDFFEPRLTERCRCLHDGSYGTTWTGLLYPCCRFEGAYGMLAIGDTRKTPLVELLQNPVMKLVRLLETVGFSPLLDAAKQVDRTLSVDYFSSGCTVCYVLFKALSFVRQFAPRIKQEKMREGVREYLDFVGKRGVLSAEQWIQRDDRPRRITLKRPQARIDVTRASAG